MSTLTNEEKLKLEVEDLWNKCESLLNTEYELLDSSKVETISNTVLQISTFMIENSTSDEMEMVLCSFCKEKDIFNKIYRWTGLNRKYLKQMAFVQLTSFNALVQKAGRKLLGCKQVMIPLLLLMLSLKPTDTRRIPPEVEFLYVNILYNISQRISNTYLLDLLSHDLYTPNEDFKISRFTFFELLLFYTHKPGEVGEMARLAILSCLKFAITNDPLNEFICHQTAACAIIAGGLSARYSSLPTTLNISSEDWHNITKADLGKMPEMWAFLNCLSFCCNVMECGNKLVTSRMIPLIYDGFLMSVLAPALNQPLIEAQIAAIAYLDLFLCFITSEYLMEIFLRALLTDAYDNKPLINLLICHINSDSEQLAIVTMQLFETLLNLNCEDILFHLIFRYLLPCNHILPNQKRTIKEMDFYCKSATMFLYLIPTSCVKARKEEESEEASPLLSMKSFKSTEHIVHSSPQFTKKYSFDSSVRSRSSDTSMDSSLNSYSSKDSCLTLDVQSFELMTYLIDAKNLITLCKRACKCWSNAYDGMDVILDNSSERNSYLNSMVRTKSTISNNISKSVSSNSINYDDSLIGLTTTDCLGPFLNALFDKLEKMMESSVYINLRLTSLVTRLACYPQPLVRSFLLNSNLVIQPGLRSLSRVLARVSSISDAFVSQLHDHQQLIRKARKNLLTRQEGRYKQLSQESAKRLSLDSSKLVKNLNNIEDTSEINCVIQSDQKTGDYSNSEQKSPTLSKTLSVDDIMCLSPWSLSQKEKQDEKDEKLVSLNTRHSKLHPAIPKLGLRSPNKKDFKQKNNVDKLDLHIKNLEGVKNAVYCVVILEEFMKELAAVSIEQTLL